MELYGRSTGRSGSQPDRPAEWGPAGAETGLEESMRRLGLWNRDNLLPERPGVLDCAYYMRTGSCGYGIKCRYNHPRDRSSAVGGALRIGGEYPERPGEPACQFYLRTGSCKFGVSCKFHHPRNGGGSISNVRVNTNGYPLRPGEKECSYYLKTGQCRFGITCKFHHPQLGSLSNPSSARSFYPAVQTSSNPSPEHYGGSSSTSFRTGTGKPPLVPGSYVPGAYGPMIFPPGVVPLPGWSYSGPVSPVLSPSAQPPAGTGSLYGVPQLSSSAQAFTGSYPSIPSSGVPSGSSQNDKVFPERPGQPDCQYYLKTGDCKFGSACKFNHPPDWVVLKTNCVLSPMGLPLRPGVEPCAFYMKNGYCKFGSMCKFDHPIGPSASSLSDVPIAPYMVSPTPLAPPFSYPESRTPPSTSSVGLIIFSQTASSSSSLSAADVQLSTQSSSSLAPRQGSEVRHSS